MFNLLLLINGPLSPEAWSTFGEGLSVMAIGMTTVILVLFFFYMIIKLLIKLFPERE